VPVAYLCTNVDPFLEKSYGTGQCVALVQHCAAAPHTSTWKRGIKVRDNDLRIAHGSIIATFDQDGKYPNKNTGNHAAIYDGQDEKGIWVYDQFWRRNPDQPGEKMRQAVSRRHIRFKGGHGSPSNDGDAYYVVE
jgi:hypothetical protein